jgi:hypothetical protein
VIVVVVEAYLADRGDVGAARQIAELLVKRGGPAAGVVGVEADAGGDAPRLPARQVDREACRDDRPLGALARGPGEPDHDEADDAGVQRPPHDRVGPLGKVVGIQGAVCIGERRGHRGCPGA